MSSGRFACGRPVGIFGSSEKDVNEPKSKIHIPRMELGHLVTVWIHMQMDFYEIYYLLGFQFWNKHGFFYILHPLSDANWEAAVHLFSIN